MGECSNPRAMRWSDEPVSRLCAGCQLVPKPSGDQDALGHGGTGHRTHHGNSLLDRRTRMGTRGGWIRGGLGGRGNPARM